MSERVINEEQAAVVRWIFQLCAEGAGLARITKQLNAAHAVCPRPQQGRPAGWRFSTVRDVLHRTLYRGEATWNKTKKRDTDGHTDQKPRPENEWMRCDRPDLRIVSDEAWTAAHARRQSRTHFKQGQLRRTGRDIDSKYLLSGFARCGTCGGSMGAVSRSHGRQRAFFYGCHMHTKSGPEVCSNALVKPTATVDEAVVARLLDQVLCPAIVTAIIDGVFDALQPTSVKANVASLKTDLRALDKKIANLVTAIENGKAIPPLAAQLHSRQTEREALLKDIGAAEAVHQRAVDRDVVAQKVLAQVEDWRAQLLTDSRQALRNHQRSDDADPHGQRGISVRSRDDRW